MSLRDRRLAVLMLVESRNGAYHAGQVGDFWAAITLLAGGKLRTRAPWHFYRKRQFPFFGGYIRSKLWLWTTYDGVKMLRGKRGES